MVVFSSLLQPSWIVAASEFHTRNHPVDGTGTSVIPGAAGRDALQVTLLVLLSHHQ